jgi:hypothetical protein
LYTALGRGVTPDRVVFVGKVSSFVVSHVRFLSFRLGEISLYLRLSYAQGRDGRITEIVSWALGPVLTRIGRGEVLTFGRAIVQGQPRARFPRCKFDARGIA